MTSKSFTLTNWHLQAGSRAYAQQFDILIESFKSETPAWKLLSYGQRVAVAPAPTGCLRCDDAPSLPSGANSAGQGFRRLRRLPRPPECRSVSPMASVVVASSFSPVHLLHRQHEPGLWGVIERSVVRRWEGAAFPSNCSPVEFVGQLDVCVSSVWSFSVRVLSTI